MLVSLVLHYVKKRDYFFLICFFFLYNLKINVSHCRGHERTSIFGLQSAGVKARNTPDLTFWLQNLCNHMALPPQKETLGN